MQLPKLAVGMSMEEVREIRLERAKVSSVETRRRRTERWFYRDGLILESRMVCCKPSSRIDMKQHGAVVTNLILAT